MSRHEHGQEHGPEREPQYGHGPERGPDGLASGDAYDEKHTTELYGPDGPLDDRTGNGIVNDGPRNGMDDHGLGGETPRTAGPGGPDALFAKVLGRDSLGPGGLDGGDLGQGELGQEELGQEELALRRMLHGAVGDLAPTEGALDHLRRAVPARRARKRQALVGLAASVVLLGTAVPAFVHVANSGGLSDDQTINAGHGEQAQGGTGTEEGEDGGERMNGSSPGQQPSTPGAPDPSEKPQSPGTGTTGGSTAGTADPTGSADASTPTCAATQLAGSAQTGAPDPDGKVYGTFRIANVSGTDCAVNGAGAVAFQAVGAADPAKISVVTHTTGDAASGLPDPSQEAATVVLKPETAYEVKFAFVPAETCPTSGASPDPSPSDGGSSGTTDGTTAAGTEPQLVADDGGTTADGSITVTHTPEPGGPNAETTIPKACAGTIYRTGALPAA
ncbi:hypothetical protein ACWGI8_00635 [Streptomyces sp. NPDC054841]